MRDQQHRTVREQLADPREQLVLSLGVERRGRLVQDHQRRVREERPRQRQPLPLPMRAENRIHGSAQQSCSPTPRPVMIAGGWDAAAIDGAEQRGGQRAREPIRSSSS